MRKTYVILVVAALLALPLTLPAVAAAQAGQTPTQFTVDLQPVNGSGVHGKAEITQQGNTLLVHLDASGLQADEAHPQLIDGRRRDKDSDCAAIAGKEPVSEHQATKAVGRVLEPLLPYPKADDNGHISYQAMVTVDPLAIGDLGHRAILLRGGMVDGRYEANLPVACGRIQPTSGPAAM